MENCRYTNVFLLVSLISDNCIETSPDYFPEMPSKSKKKKGVSSVRKISGSRSNKLSYKNHKRGKESGEGQSSLSYKNQKRGQESGEGQSSLELSTPVEGISDADLQTAAPERQTNANSHEASSAKNPTRKHGSHTFGQTIPAQSKVISCLYAPI